MKLLDRILPWRRARIRRVLEALDPDYSRYNNPIFQEGDVINATWKLVMVDGVLRPTRWDGHK